MESLWVICSFLEWRKNSQWSMHQKYKLRATTSPQKRHYSRRESQGEDRPGGWDGSLASQKKVVRESLQHSTPGPPFSLCVHAHSLLVFLCDQPVSYAWTSSAQEVFHYSLKSSWRGGSVFPQPLKCPPALSTVFACLPLPQVAIGVVEIEWDTEVKEIRRPLSWSLVQANIS